MAEPEQRGDPIWRYLLIIALSAALLAATRTPGYFERLQRAPAIIYYVLREELIDRPAREETVRWNQDLEDARYERDKAVQRAQASR